MAGKAGFWLTVGLLVVFLTGCGSGESEPSPETRHQLRSSLAEYQTYLQRSAAKLLHWNETIVLKVDEGSAGKAQSRFAASQVPAGHIAPVSDLSSKLPSRQRLEKVLFGEETTAGLEPVARELRVETEALQRRIETSDFSPGQIVAGANRVLGEIFETELPGSSGRYTQDTLAVVAAQTEGVDAALEAVEPLLAEADPELLARIDRGLQKVYTAVGEYGIFAKEPEQTRPQEPGIAFVVYSEFDAETLREIAQPVEALAADVEQAEAELRD